MDKFNAMLADPNSATKADNYAIQRNKVTSQIRAAKKSYYAKKMDDAAGDSGKTFKNLKVILGKSTKSSPHAITDENNELHHDPTKIVNLFNEAFSSIGEKLGSDIPRASNTFPVQRQIQSMYLRPTTVNEIVKIADKLKKKESHRT